MGYTFNLILAILLLVFMIPIMIVIAIFVKFTSHGPIIYWSKRISKNDCLVILGKGHEETQEEKDEIKFFSDHEVVNEIYK